MGCPSPNSAAVKKLVPLAWALTQHHLHRKHGVKVPSDWQSALTSALSVAAVSVIDGSAIFHASRHLLGHGNMHDLVSRRVSVPHVVCQADLHTGNMIAIRGPSFAICNRESTVQNSKGYFLTTTH